MYIFTQTYRIFCSLASAEKAVYKEAATANFQKDFVYWQKRDYLDSPNKLTKLTYKHADRTTNSCRLFYMP